MSLIHKACALVTLVCVPFAHASTATPYFSIRSQSVDAARELIGWQTSINLCGMESTYGSFSVTPQYTQTFNTSNIVTCLFNGDVVNGLAAAPDSVDGCCKCQASCTNCSSQIVVSGSDVTTRASTDWLADYFGLPTDFKSILSFNPEIQNVNFDLNFYLGLDALVEGFFFRIHAPISWTRWNLQFQEKVVTQGSNSYVAGYFSDDGVLNTGLLANATAFFIGRAPTLTSNTDATNPIGPVFFDQLKFAKFVICNGCNNTLVRLSDIELALGYNFLCSDDYHLGVELRASAPTGNKPVGTFAFEPIIGSGGHWKIGGGVSTHYIFWSNEENSSSLGFWVDGNVQHLFAAHQIRTFDLKDKPNSRYALAEKISTPTSTPANPLTTPTTGISWINEFSPVANLTASRVNVNVAVEGDVVIKFAYLSASGFQADLGYEFWARTCENICLPDPSANNLTNDTTWALKGTAFVVGFLSDAGTADTDNPVRLAATDSTATIHGGSTVPADSTNPTINTPVAAQSNSVAVLDIFDDAVNSSKPPIYIKTADIGYADAQTKGMSNKVFMHLSYAWQDYESWMPFLGVGASAEFNQGGSCNGCTPTPTAVTASTSPACGDSCTECDKCHECGISQWSVWVKGGISFY